MEELSGCSLLAEIRAKTILIICLYGPSSGDSEDFFRDELFPIMRDKNYHHCMIGGDWNVGMQPEDYKGYADPSGKQPKSGKARQGFHVEKSKYNK